MQLRMTMQVPIWTNMTLVGDAVSKADEAGKEKEDSDETLLFGAVVKL